MISITLTRNSNSHICAFSVENHSAVELCEAVSILTMNTINCIELFTNEVINVFVNDEGGLLRVELPRLKEGHENHEANLLLETMAVGLWSTKEWYDEEVEAGREVGIDLRIEDDGND
jgi:uncharacterized protein YsxB (DUF464 family)